METLRGDLSDSSSYIEFRTPPIISRNSVRSLKLSKCSTKHEEVFHPFLPFSICAYSLESASLHVCAAYVVRCFTKIDSSVSLMIFEEKLQALEKRGKQLFRSVKCRFLAFRSVKCSCSICLLVIFKILIVKKFHIF